MSAHNSDPCATALWQAVTYAAVETFADDDVLGQFPVPAEQLDPLQRALWIELSRKAHNAEDIMRTIWFEDAPEGTPEDWSRLMVQTRAAVITRRTLREVAQMHAMSPRELMALVVGRRMLNIGAGDSTVARELEEAGMPVDLTSVDISKTALLGQPGRTVRADAASLPFADASFDAVWLTYSLPLWANSARQAVGALDEGLRVTAVGGVLKVAPIALAHARISIDRYTGVEIVGSLSEEDPRLRMVLHAVDLAMLQWLWRVAGDDRFVVTLETASHRTSAMDMVTSATIRRVR